MSLSTHLYSFTQDPTSFIKLGLKSGFHQLESSLAHDSVTTFLIKKRKKHYKRLIFGVYSP